MITDRKTAMETLTVGFLFDSGIFPTQLYGKTHDRIFPVLKLVQERSRVSPAIRGRVPPPQNFLIFLIFIFDLKMAIFDAFLVVFYAI